MSNQSLIERLKIRAQIRRQIPNRKSVQEGKEDRIANLLDEAATQLNADGDTIEKLEKIVLNVTVFLILSIVLNVMLFIQ